MAAFFSKASSRSHYLRLGLHNAMAELSSQQFHYGAMVVSEFVAALPLVSLSVVITIEEA